MLFRSTVPVVEPVRDDVVASAEPVPVPVSLLTLDLGEPGDGWHSFLASRGIEVLSDDLGRDAISRADAKQLFDEQRENEARRREALAQRELEAVEADHRFRAQLNPGTPWWDIGMGVAPAAAMLQAGYEAERPRSVYTTLLESELSGSDGSLVYHSFRED